MIVQSHIDSITHQQSGEEGASSIEASIKSVFIIDHAQVAISAALQTPLH